MDLICKTTAERLSREVVEYRVSSTVITRAWYDCNGHRWRDKLCIRP